MKIEFYHNSSEKNKINKRLTKLLDLSGTLRDECSMANPVVLVNASNLSGVDYCYIPEFNRYYFINDIVSVRTGLWRVSLNCDVLESFKDKILNLNCIIDKQYNLGLANKLFDDGSYITQADTFSEVVKFSSGFSSSGEFILITAGAISG